MIGAIALLGAISALMGGWFIARAGWSRSGPASLNSAAFSAGWAALAVVVAALLFRGIGYLAGASGPFAWTMVTPGAPTDAAPHLMAFSRLVGAYAIVAFATMVVHAFARGARPRPAGPVLGAATPLAPVAAGIAIVSGLAVAVAFISGPIPWSAAGLAIDIAAVVPVAAITLGIRLFARGDIAKAPEKKALPSGDAPAAAPAGPVDIEPKLKAANALGEKPLFEVATKKNVAPQHAGALDRVWHAAGGTGAAPASLKAIVESIGFTSAAQLVGDLPEPTEDALVRAALIQALCGAGERVLVIGEAPEARRDGLRAALAKQGLWAPGALVAGGAELERALHEGALPAAAFVDLDALNQKAIRLFGAGLGRRFADGLGLVVIVRPDGLPPLATTHLLFAMRRLGLVFHGRDRLPAMLATGSATAGSRRFVEELVGRAVKLVPAGLEETGSVRVHRGPLAAAANRSAQAEAVKTALNVLAGASVEVAVEDPNGQLAAADIENTKLKTRLVRRPSFHAPVSFALLDDGWIAQLFRSARHLLPSHVAPRHTSIWWVPQTPLSRFLLLPNVLQSLDQTGELPTPRPVAGKKNKWLAAAHLEAAVSEGAHDEAALRAAFGDEAVSERLELEPKLRISAHRARTDGQGNGIRRSPVWEPPPGHRWEDPNRTTVTRDVLEIVDEQSGTVLDVIDRRVAPTRYYPLRVFGVGGGRFRVPAEAYAQGSPRGKLYVRPADERAAWTAPNLDVMVQCNMLRDEPVVVARNELSIAVVQAPVDVTERVASARTLDATGSDVSFAPVEAKYPSRAAVMFLANLSSPRALHHLARVIDAILPAHVRAAQEDIEVVALPQGLGGLPRPALAFVDRHLGGMGVAETLDAEAMHDLLRWARGVLFHCPCMDGCANCTPPEVLKAGADKQGVLKMLGTGAPARKAG